VRKEEEEERKPSMMERVVIHGSVVIALSANREHINSLSS
jgi:hypothetical protein